MTHVCSVLTILFAAIATGSSLICRECDTHYSGFCKGEPYKCAARAKSCIQTYAITKIGDKVSKSFSRACNDDEHLCDRELVMNGGEGNKQARFITECCKTDDCNRCKMKVPPYNATVNGLICPVCFSHNTYDCVSRGYIRCKGMEIDCIDFAATMHKEGFPDFKFSLLGCITPAGCSLGPKIAPAVKVVDTKRLSCTSAIPITHL